MERTGFVQSGAYKAVILKCLAATASGVSVRDAIQVAYSLTHVWDRWVLTTHLLNT